MSIGSDIGDSSYGGLSAGLSDDSWNGGGGGISGAMSGGWGDDGDSGGSFSTGNFGSWGSIDSSGNAIGTGGATDNAQAISNMSVQEQEKFFRDVVDPLMSDTYSGFWPGVAEFVSKMVIGGMSNQVLGGIGTLSGLSGNTGQTYDKIVDAAVSQKLSEELGISDPTVMENALNAIRAAGGQGFSSAELYEKMQNTTSGGTNMSAAGTAASYQQQALDYMKEADAIPRQFSESALQTLGGGLGLGGDVTAEQFMSGFKSSPIYSAAMGGLESGEEAILRSAGATGGLRSGNVQDALARYSGDLENTALNNYIQQLGVMTGLPSYTTQIADLTSGIGSTLAAGQTAEAQMEQAELGQWLGLGSSILQASGGISGVADTASSWAKSAISALGF